MPVSVPGDDEAFVTAACAAIPPPDLQVAAQVQAALNNKTKPRGSLGRLETLACQLAAARGRVPEPPQKAIVVMGADHGVAESGVSAYPAAVTTQMLLNFARGGAAINVLARQVGARVVVVDMGTLTPPEGAPQILSRRLGAGTANMTQGPAMAPEQAAAGVRSGIQVARDLTDQGITLIGVGEMGIGNSTAASAITSALLDLPPELTVGRGTGVDDEGLGRKRMAVGRALELNRAHLHDPMGVLRALGGFELAGLVGVMLGAAARRVPVIVDGFIASAAALLAVRLAPPLAAYLVAGHQSVEPGHAHVLAALGLKPLLQLEMRLGEGTGAALAMGLADAAVRVLHEMATFAQAQVDESGLERPDGSS